jgi:GT2 family glycosyltransferase
LFRDQALSVLALVQQQLLSREPLQLKKEKTYMQEAPTLHKHAIVTDSEQGFVPILMREIELGQPLPILSAFDKQRERTYQRARCLVRLHTQPLGLVDLTFDMDELSPDEYAPHIWQTLEEQINAHLRKDGLSEVTMLDATGLSSIYTPKCLKEHEVFLQRAPFASVVVSTRDRPDRLARCLPTLLALHYPNYEIIVVDNAPSTTATADFIRQHYADEPKIHYVREDRPGLSSGRNRGIQEARGDIIAITDDDVIVDAYWLAALAKGFEAAENVACVTSLLLPLELETPAQVLLEEFGGFSKGFAQRIFDRKSGRQGNPLYPFTAGKFGSGGGLALTATFLQKEGHFDPALGNGTPSGAGEDLAVFFNVIMRGYCLVYEPESLVYHEHHRDYAKLQKQLYYYGSSISAYLTKVVINNPLLLFRLITLIPYGLFFILSPRSEKNKKKSSQFPKELARLEIKGMLRGAFLYIKGRWEISHPPSRQIKKIVGQ